MAVFSIEIADEHVDRILTAMCANYKYEAQVRDPNSSSETNPGAMMDNPESPYHFVNRITREYLINNTTDYEIKLAKQQALASVGSAPVITNPAV